MFKYALLAASALILISDRLTDGALVGEACTLDGTSNCTVANSFCLKNSVCQQGICRCKTGFKTLFNSPTDCFVATISLNSACLDNAQCGQFAQCGMGSRCSCPAGYRAAADGINCLKGTVALGGTCTTSTDCGTMASCNATSSVCVCSNAGYKPTPGDTYSCTLRTNGESCTSNVCDYTLGLQCTSGQCQCPSGQEWKNVVIGPSQTGFRCVSTQATFGHTYGQDCHDLFSLCGNSGLLRACASDLVCTECPEDTGNCIRKCLIYSDTQTTPAPTTTTTAPTTTTVTQTTPSSGTTTVPNYWRHMMVAMTSVIALLTLR